MRLKNKTKLKKEKEIMKTFKNEALKEIFEKTQAEEWVCANNSYYTKWLINAMHEIDVCITTKNNTPDAINEILETEVELKILGDERECLLQDLVSESFYMTLQDLIRLAISRKERIEKKIESLVAKIDMTELHHAVVFSNSGDNIIVWEDGTFDILSSGTYPGETEEEYIIIKAQGIGNIDSTQYSNGFYTQTELQMENGLFYNPETGRELTLNEMVAECIDEGEWGSFASDIKNQLRAQLEMRAA